MKERPILFSAPMVRAILDGTKTQTRRVVKHDIRGPSEPMDTFDWYDKTGKWVGAHGRGFPFKKTNAALLCPYGQPGDRLWVREAWARTTVFGGAEMVVYREGDNRTDYGGPWKPSIHMPRWASRITLEVTGVRVERLQNISCYDALAEGIAHTHGGFGMPDGSHFHCNDPRQSYFSLWEAINGPGSVAANPWVWVVAFKRMEGCAA